MIVKRIVPHTAGPWTVDALGLHVTAPNEAMRICDIRGWGHLTGQGGLRLSEADAIAVQTANANLIAAAPELLAACRAFVDWYNVDSTEQKRDDAFHAAQAAIGKAEGQS